MTQETLESVMSRRLIAVGADDPIAAAVDQMVHRDVGAILVKREGEVVGIVTERDILRAAAKGGDILGRRVSNAMPQRPLITATPGDSPLQALRLMSEHAVRRIPVTEGGKVVGIVTEKDLVRWLLGRPEAILELLSPEPLNLSRDALVKLLRQAQERARV